ncbi:MAG TPA: prepilin-type N-terminal cleavage/methylation domain-containing protein [Patescibacteria group bacterium]
MIKKIQAGMTLIEALIAIAIFTIGIGGFSLLFVKSWQSNSYVFEMGQSSIAASQGVNEAIGYLRKSRQGDDGSYPIKSATDNDLVIFSDYDKDGITERLHFFKSGDQLMLGWRKPTGSLPKTYAAGDQGTKMISKRVVNDAATPVFYYYNKDYPADQVNNPVATPAAASDIKLIKVLLKVNMDPNRAPDNIEISSFAELRNLNDYDRMQ